MKKHQDAYGHEVYDYLKHGIGCEIVERDDGFVDISSGPAEYFTEYEDWGPHLRKAIGYARGRVLDVGCGAGRHSLYLQKRGHAVVGIDLSPLAVKVAKLRGLKSARVMPVTKVSRKLGEFDTIVMFGNNFGLFGNARRAKWLLARYKSITNDEARILVESVNPYVTSDECHMSYHRRNRKRGRMSGQLRIRVRYQTYITPWFEYLIVSPDEMKELLVGTGWRVAKLFGTDGPVYAAVIERE
jgi:hypothetical protein